MIVNVWVPNVSSARIVQLNVTLPSASATCVPSSSGVDCWVPVTVSLGRKPLP